MEDDPRIHPSWRIGLASRMLMTVGAVNAGVGVRSLVAHQPVFGWYMIALACVCFGMRLSFLDSLHRIQRDLP